jgi:CheY-like chemotaxis protein
VTNPSESLEGFRVLLVEDHDDTRGALTALLEHAGALVWPVADVDSGLRVLDRTSVDVVLSDIAMPGRDGISFIRELRSRESLSTLPAIAVTAQIDAIERRLILAAGYNAHVPKPGVDDLVATIRQVVAAARNPTSC